MRPLSKLTHIDPQGRAKMVDVGDKDSTQRIAVAQELFPVNTPLSSLNAHFGRRGLETGQIQESSGD